MSYVLIHLRTRIVPWLDVLLLLRIRFGFRLETCERKKRDVNNEKSEVPLYKIYMSLKKREFGTFSRLGLV